MIDVCIPPATGDVAWWSNASLISDSVTPVPYQLFINKETVRAYSYLAQSDSLQQVISNPVNDGQFKILMSTYDRDSNIKMYLNGHEVGSTDISNIINSNSDYPLEIGHEFFTAHSNKYYFDGEIAEILFFDNTLLEKRIEVLAYLSARFHRLQ